MSWSSIIAVVVLSIFTQVDASKFLEGSHSALDSVSFEARSDELQAALGAVLGCTDGKGEVQQVRNVAVSTSLLPVWKSLPKNEHGRVGWKLVRYMAHRHFMQQFGVLVRGLEPTIQVNSSHAGEADILSLQAPGLAQQLSGSQAKLGFSLDDATNMVVALEQLLFHSDSVLLEKVYREKGYDTHVALTKNKLQNLLKHYMVYWMLGDDEESAAALLKNSDLLYDSVPHWAAIIAMVEGSVTALEFSRYNAPTSGTAANTFAGLHTFEDALAVAGSISRNFGHFWEAQCQDTKDSLIAFDTTHTGRVRLPSFYGANKEGEWRFGESEAYLRELGALDETSSWRGKQVIVSNYMQAASNCVVTRPHYLVCCMVDCEDILGQVESAVGAPVASVDEVLSLVTNMTHADDEPVLVGDELKNQLIRMAGAQGGNVLLHGRLFAQWLHYIFPRECAFPHKAGNAASRTPTQFGDKSVVSPDEVSKYVADDVVLQDIAGGNSSAGQQDWMSQWSEDEELLGDYTRQLSGSGEFSPVVAMGGAAVLLGLVFAGVTKGAAKPTTHSV